MRRAAPDDSGSTLRDWPALLAEVIEQRDPGGPSADVPMVLASLRLEELVLARACMAGHDTAWDIFLTRYRSPMYEAAYKIARDEATARALADSLYADLYGVNQRGEASHLQAALLSGARLAGRMAAHRGGAGICRTSTVAASARPAWRRRWKMASSSRPPSRPASAPDDPRIATATASELAALDAGRALPVVGVLSGSPHAGGDCQAAARA